MKRIRELCRIEREIRNRDADARLAGRKKKSKPKVKALKAWAEHQRTRVSVKSGLGEALAYLLSHRKSLIVFLSDGRVEMDSNPVERSIRPVALNRKNALFAGHDEGAENQWIVDSLIETCKLNGVDPLEWPVDAFAAFVGGWPQDRIEDLPP